MKDYSEFDSMLNSNTSRSKVREKFNSPSRNALYFTGPNAGAVVNWDRRWADVQRIFDNNELNVDPNSVEYDCRRLCIRRDQDPDRQFTKTYHLNSTPVALFHHLQQQLGRLSQEIDPITLTGPLWYFVLIEQYEPAVMITDTLYKTTKR